MRMIPSNFIYCVSTMDITWTAAVTLALEALTILLIYS